MTTSHHVSLPPIPNASSASDTWIPIYEGAIRGQWERLQPVSNPGLGTIKTSLWTSLKDVITSAHSDEDITSINTTSAQIGIYTVDGNPQEGWNPSIASADEASRRRCGTVTLAWDQATKTTTMAITVDDGFVLNPVALTELSKPIGRILTGTQDPSKPGMELP